jgi:hypothetical protein
MKTAGQHGVIDGAVGPAPEDPIGLAVQALAHHEVLKSEERRCQLPSLAGPENGRTIPLPDLSDRFLLRRSAIMSS